jgi:hypothetical protein
MTKLSQCTLLFIMTICSFDIQAGKSKKNEPKRKRLPWVQHTTVGANPRGTARAARTKRLKKDRHTKALEQTYFEVTAAGIKKHTSVENFLSLQEAATNKAQKSGAKKPQFATSKRTALQILAALQQAKNCKKNKK